MLIETLFICSLTFAAPYYDCGETWYIQMYDQRFIPEVCNGVKLVRGCMNQKTFRGITGQGKYYEEEGPIIIHIGSEHGTLTTDFDFPYSKWLISVHSVLYHELTHAKCKCDWHD